MNNIIRFWNQNKRGIITLVAAIVLFIVIIQSLNQMAKMQNEKKNNSYNELTEEEKKLPTESIIGGSTLSIEATKDNIEIIEEFIEKCNNKDIDGAYSMLTEECKEELYSTKENFQKGYYDIVFNNKKIVNIENFMSSNKRYTYKVTIYEDMLSTGNVTNSKTYVDYITIDENSIKGKLNINSFIFKEEVHEESEIDGIKIEVLEKKIYKDNEQYKIKVENNTKKRIMIDTKTKNKSIYLVGSNNVSYNSYISEISSTLLEIPANFYRNYEIKFNKIYSSGISTKGIVFSDIVADFEKYEQNPKEENNRIKISINM